jgi:hypothetical protein
MSMPAAQEWIRRMHVGHSKKQAPSEAARDALHVRDAQHATEAGSHVMIHRELWELWCSVRIHYHHTTTDLHNSVLKGQHKYLRWWGRDTGAKHGWLNPDMPLQKRQGVWSPFYHQCEQYLHRVRGLSLSANAASLIAGPESFAVATVSLVSDVWPWSSSGSTYRRESPVGGYPIS